MFDLEKAEHTIPVVDGVMCSNIYFNWEWEHRGFGQLSVDLDRETGKITIGNECMSRETVRKILHAYVDYIVNNGELEYER